MPERVKYLRTFIKNMGAEESVDELLDEYPGIK